MIASDSNLKVHEQHLFFLRTHRGDVEKLGPHTLVTSNKSQYTYVVLGDGGSEDVLDRFATVHLVPWSGDWVGRLCARGYVEKEGINYMVLDGLYSEWANKSEVSVKLAGSAEDYEQFTEIQGRAFLPSADAYQQWQPWLLQQNLQVMGQPEHKFYIGSVNGVPVGVALTIANEDTLGLYAVATLSQFRGQGIATFIMKRALEDSDVGSKKITLQTAAGSSAERLYKKLGFSSAFLAHVYSRE